MSADISPASSISATHKPNRKSRSYAQTIVEGYRKKSAQQQQQMAGRGHLPPLGPKSQLPLDASLQGGDASSPTGSSSRSGDRRSSSGGKLRKMKSFYERRLEKESAATFHVVEKLEAVAESLNSELRTLRINVYGVEEDDNLGLHHQEVQEELETKLETEQDPSRLLLKAAKDGNLALCLKLLTQYSVNADAVDEQGYTALGHLILKIDQDELYYDKESRRRMLRSIIEQLIYNGANVNRPCPNGKSPFWIVADENELDLMTVMIEAPRPYVENGKLRSQHVENAIPCQTLQLNSYDIHVSHVSHSHR